MNEAIAGAGLLLLVAVLGVIWREIKGSRKDLATPMGEESKDRESVKEKLGEVQVEQARSAASTFAATQGVGRLERLIDRQIAEGREDRERLGRVEQRVDDHLEGHP